MNKVKEIIKHIPGVGGVLGLRNLHMAKRVIVHNINNYANVYLQHSTSYPEINDPLRYRREIIIGAHILEKGLSHSDFRPGFGKKAIIDLQSNIQRYLQEDNTDIFALTNAISLLKNYHDLNKSNGFDDSDYVNQDLFSYLELKDLMPYPLEQQNYAEMTFEELAANRHSVRCYEESGLEIEEDELNDVISLANTAPSACNRQATHIFVIRDKDKMEKLEAIHGGCKNFGVRASAFLLVTSDLALYSRNEVKIPSYDAGIYSMNLLYALQSKGFYSCILNGSFPGNAYREVHELTSIPERFDINGLIAVYKLDRVDHIKIAASSRREAKDTVTFISD